MNKVFRQHMKQTILERKIRPKLVGFLSNEEPASIKYAEWTSKTCDETGVDFQLVKVPKEDLEKSILKANKDSSVNGIMVYYPVFNTHGVCC
jgi:methylenetetrahydrofolate dehydrogenase (NAD+)